MAYKCDKCGKGKEHGHMVSHAKNRLKRLFLPNLQRIPVLKSGRKTVAKLCMSCLKRLKKDKKFGIYGLINTNLKKEQKVKTEVQKAIKKVSIPVKSSQKEKEEVKEKFDIASIVGKKN